MPADDPAAYRRGSMGDTIGYGDFTFDTHHRDRVPDFEVSPKTKTFDKNTVYVDLETTGLRTKSYNVLNVNPQQTTPGIMEIATFYREAGETTAKPVGSLTGYSDVIPKEVLDNLDEPTLKRLTQREHHGPGSRVDEAVLQDGKLRDIFMDYKEAVETGKYPKTDIPANLRTVEQYVEGFTDVMKKAAEGPGGVLTGWNISFDVNMMLDTAKAVDAQKGTNHAASMVDLMESGKVQVKDLDDPLRRYMFHQAMTGRGTPEHLSRKAINEELQRAGTTDRAAREAIVKDIEKHGVGGHKSKYVGINDPLVQLGEDVRAYETNKNVFSERLQKSLTEKNPMLGNLGKQDLEVVEQVAEQLATVAKAQPGDEAYEAYKLANRNLKEMVRESGTGRKSQILNSLVKGGYGSGSQSLIGSIFHEQSHLPWNTLDDLTSALDFVGGRTQDIMADIMGHPMAGSAHVAMADIPMGSEMSSRLEEIVDRAMAGDEEAAKAMDNMITESKARRFTEIASEVVKQDGADHRAAAGAVNAADQVMSSSAGSKLKGAYNMVGGWKGVAGAAAAGFIANELFNNSPQVEGVRASYSQYDQAHGIAPTGDPSLTPYGSGRDAKFQLLSINKQSQDYQKRAIHREALYAGREALHAPVSPINHMTVAKDNRRRLRGSIEEQSGYGSYERVILPSPPPVRPDQSFSAYDMDTQAQFSRNVQSNSHSSIAEHPDHDHGSPGLVRSPMPILSKESPVTSSTIRDSAQTPEPNVKSSITRSSARDLSSTPTRSKINANTRNAKMSPPPARMPSSHTGNSKVRDQGAKSLYSTPSLPKPTANQSRFIRTEGQQ